MCLMRVLFLANLYVASLSDYHVKVTMSRFQRLMSCWIKQLAVCKGTIEMIILDPHPYHPDLPNYHPDLPNYHPDLPKYPDQR